MPATSLPDLGGLVVARDAVRLVAFEDGDVQARRVELPDLASAAPTPTRSPLLEVIAEATSCRASRRRCGAARAADVVEVVVLAAGADALLRVGRPRVRRASPCRGRRLELVHAGVGEQQRRVVVRHDRRRRARTCARASCTKKSMNCWRISLEEIISGGIVGERGGIANARHYVLRDDTVRALWVPCSYDRGRSANVLMECSRRIASR